METLPETHNISLKKCMKFLYNNHGDKNITNKFKKMLNEQLLAFINDDYNRFIRQEIVNDRDYILTIVNIYETFNIPIGYHYDKVIDISYPEHLFDISNFIYDFTIHFNIKLGCGDFQNETYIICFIDKLVKHNYELHYQLILQLYGMLKGGVLHTITYFTNNNNNDADDTQLLCELQKYYNYLLANNDLSKTAPTIETPIIYSNYHCDIHGSRFSDYYLFKVMKCDYFDENIYRIFTEIIQPTTVKSSKNKRRNEDDDMDTSNKR
jgi:hypothetical protein